MESKLRSVLSGKVENHLLPFLWMHENRTEYIRPEIDAIYASGARAFCVESRPHEFFCQDEWWRDMDVILDEAQKLGMKVWILDDKHFPTGYANGLIARKYPHLRKKQLYEDHVDVMGPQTDIMLRLRKGDPEERIIAIYAYRLVEFSEFITGEPIDLTGCVHGDYLICDLPEGAWRIFYLTLTQKPTSNQYADYIDNIDRESAHVQIEAVYEPHYEHYSHLFGTVIAGFFSDEPCLGNGYKNWRGNMNCSYSYTIGTRGLALPWSDELLRRMTQSLGVPALPLAPLLWYKHTDCAPDAADVRNAYMDAVTALWRENFSYQIGDWCRAHGVEYIGHIIEDNNSSARLGCSCGHYFRSLDGQDMAGIDIVLHQYMPGFDHNPHAAIAAGACADTDFYHYTLAKLAASHAHIQPRMRGRAMCEAFGAFGWAESVSFMKAMMDHLLIRGVNYFVPHAFTTKFPDPDCPPHFYAHGQNPQFGAYSELMGYVNRVSTLLTGLEHVADAAILYHAEAEWGSSGELRRPYMLSQTPARVLYDAQIDYDIIPADFLYDGAGVDNGELVLGRACTERGERRKLLIVPGTQYLPDELIKRLSELEADGLHIVFVDYKPDDCRVGRVVPLDNLVGHVRSLGTDVGLSPRFDFIRVYHCRDGASDIFMCSNESATTRYDGVLTVGQRGACAQYDACRQTQRRFECDGGLPLSLEPLETVFFVFGHAVKAFDEYALPVMPDGEAAMTVLVPTGDWTIESADSTDMTAFEPVAFAEYGKNLMGAHGVLDNDFAGLVRYTANFEIADGESINYIGIEEPAECCELTVNGQSLGWQYCAPYRWNAAGALKSGNNTLTITIANTLTGVIEDPFSHFMPIKRFGVFGDIYVV